MRRVVAQAIGAVERVLFDGPLDEAHGAAVGVEDELGRAGGAGRLETQRSAVVRGRRQAAGLLTQGLHLLPGHQRHCTPGLRIQRRVEVPVQELELVPGHRVPGMAQQLRGLPQLGRQHTVQPLHRQQGRQTQSVDTPLPNYTVEFDSRIIDQGIGYLR